MINLRSFLWECIGDMEVIESYKKLTVGIDGLTCGDSLLLEK